MRSIGLLWIGLVFSHALGAFADVGAQESALIWDETPTADVRKIFDHPIGFASDSPVTPTRAMRVLWWNIRYGGGLSRTLQARARLKDPDAVSSLDENLKVLAGKKDGPDLMALGEFIPDSLERLTIEVLERAYPYHRYFPYNPQIPDRGIAIYSRVPFSSQTVQVDWTDLRETPPAQEYYRRQWEHDHGVQTTATFERPLINLTLNWQGREIHVVPVHLLMPWLLIQKGFPAVGKELTGLSLMFGDHNPLVNQVVRFKAELEKMLQQKKSQQKGGAPALMILGDFNLPDSVYGVAPYGFRLMQEGLYRAFQSPRSTFPAQSAEFKGQIRDLTIDHAWVSSSVHVDEAQVLPLRGSDHYPITVGIEAARSQVFSN